MAQKVTIRTSITGVATVQGGLGGIATSLGRVGTIAQVASAKLNTFGKAMRRTGLLVTASITAPLGLGILALTKFAAAAQETENLFEVSMGDMATEARAFSEELQKNFGLNAFAMRKNIGVLNVMLMSMGLGEEAAFGMAKGLVVLSEDMASFFDLPVEESFLKIQSALAGEAEALKRLGIVIQDEIIKFSALERGIIKQGESLNLVQKVGLRYLEMMKRTEAQQGDLARTIGSVTNQMRLLRASTINLAIDTGTNLLPVAQTLITLAKSIVVQLREWGQEFKNATPRIKGFALMVGVATLAVGPFLVVIGALVLAFKFLVFPLVAVAIPLTIFTTSMIALALVINRVIERFGSLKTAVTEVVDAFKNKFGVLIPNVVKRAFGTVVDAVESTFKKLGITVEEPFEKIKEKAEKVGGDFKRTFKPVINEFLTEIEKIKNKILDFFAAPFKASGMAFIATQKEIDAFMQSVLKGTEETSEKLLTLLKTLGALDIANIQKREAAAARQTLALEKFIKELERQAKIEKLSTNEMQVKNALHAAELKLINQKGVVLRELTTEERRRIEIAIELKQARIKEKRDIEDMRRSAEAAFDRVADSMVRAFVTGENAAKSFRNIMFEVLLDIQSEIIKIAISNPLKQMLGLPTTSTGGGLLNIFKIGASLFGGGPATATALGGPVATIHSGGTGLGIAPKRTVNSSIFRNAPRLHRGISTLASDEFPAILQKGERVIPKGGNSQEASITVNQTIQISTGVSQTVRTEILGLMPRIISATKVAIADANSRGGKFREAMT